MHRRKEFKASPDSVSKMLELEKDKKINFLMGQIQNIEGLNNKKIKIEGEILSTCPMKGCWMKMSIAQDTVLVRFKDYGFFVPKSGAEGKSAIVTLSIRKSFHCPLPSGNMNATLESPD